MTKKDIELYGLTVLETSGVRLFRSSPKDARLRLTLNDDRSWMDVRPSLAFPLSDPEGYVGLRDSRDREIGLIEDPGRLDAESCAALREELDRRYFTPKILSISSATELTGTVAFVVQTHRGERRFVVRNLRDNSIPLGANRVLLTDVDGNRYDIPNVGGLGPEPYRILSKVLQP